LLHPILSPPGSTVLLMGNEAIARGSIEAGVGFASAYPGTPSTEIIETLSKIANHIGIHVEWSTNEKVAFEAAYGAAISGVRSLVAMKHVGMNVAADALMSSAYTGVEGGFVIVTADDPNMWSSQNEQDNRYYGLHAYIPVLEAYDPMEAKEIVKYAFQLSEKYKHPVIIRSTTRLSHSRGPVKLEETPKIKIKGKFKKNFEKYVIIPSNARRLRGKLIEKWRKIREEVNETPFNKYVNNGSNILIIASGMAYGYVMDSLKILNYRDKVNILKISTTVPIPEKLVEKALREVEKVLVVEELEPIVENEVKRIAFEREINVEIKGKEHIPLKYELNVDKVVEGISKLLKIRNPLIEETIKIEYEDTVPIRPPTLCPGCPHRAIFLELKWAAKRMGLKEIIHCGDIGCYSLGAYQPFQTQDIILEMGGSIGVANGLAHTVNEPIISIMGDSTFYHACIPGIINALYNNTPLLVMVLDNRITAMTGHQPHPGTGITATGKKTRIIDVEGIAKGIGIRYVKTLDPFKVNETIEEIIKALKYVKEKRETAVLIVKRACALMISSIARRRGIKAPKYQVNYEKCRACGICYNQLNCPAISSIENGKATIDEYLCVGCSVCAQICPFNAIETLRKPSDEWEQLWRRD